MADKIPAMTLQTIGTVRNQLTGRARRDVKNTVSKIVVASSLTEALDNLDEFSHIIVLYWMHLSRQPAPMKVHPRRRAELSPVGVFASRSPDRPNPIGKATVRLLGRRDNILTVEGLDAVDGTPVIDIKPYIPGIDSADDAATPPWLTEH